MAVCKQCGKRVYFGHLNNEKLCAKCVEKNEAEARAAEEAARESEYIEEIFVGRDRSDEETACRFFIEEFAKQGKNPEKFRIVQDSSEYSSLEYAMTEIVRIRMTEHVKWISVLMEGEHADTYREDPIFEWQTDKTQKFWKSYFKRLTDLFKYADIVAGITLIDYYGIGREITEAEGEALDYVYDLFVQCGADPDKFYMYELSNAVELLYASLGGRVRIRMTGEGQKGAIVDNIISGGKYEFEELTALEEMVPEYIPWKIREGNANEMDMRRYRKFER